MRGHFTIVGNAAMNGKMSKQNTQPTIAELWREFQKIEVKHRFALNRADFEWKDARKNWLASAENWRIERQALRSQLIERCANVKDSKGYFSLFEINRGKIETQLVDECENLVRIWRIDTAETAREMSAAYAFWAWELEQRQKEARNG